VVFHGTLDISFGVPLGGRLSFVVELLALSYPEVHLHISSGEMKIHRNEGISLLLGLFSQLHYLSFVKEELYG